MLGCIPERGDTDLPHSAETFLPYDALLGREANMNSISDALAEALEHPIIDGKAAVGQRLRFANRGDSNGILWAAVGAIGIAMLLHLFPRRGQA